MLDQHFYNNILYPLQDKILAIVESCKTDFYLTGGTALGRHYLNHRFSDDLDFFTNSNPSFKKSTEHIIKIISETYECEVALTANTFVRIFITSNDTILKVEFIDDVSYHFGSFEQTSLFYKTDNWRNILSNKISALSRMAAKDVSDILFIAMNFSFNWKEIINEAKKKDMWVDEIAVSQYFNNFDVKTLDSIKWKTPPDSQGLQNLSKKIAKSILIGEDNLV